MKLRNHLAVICAAMLCLTFTVPAYAATDLATASPATQSASVFDKAKARQARDGAELKAKCKAELLEQAKRQASALDKLKAGQKAARAKLAAKQARARVKLKAGQKAARAKLEAGQASAKALHKAKSHFIARTDKLYSAYSHLMTAGQRKAVRGLVAKCLDAGSTRAIDRLASMRDLVVDRARISAHVSGTQSWSRGKLDYVAEWGKRNDAFLEGKPMAGCGYIIAAAAYDHDMDPRICSAIARVESDCGVAPYGCPYNVWGWIWNPPAMYGWEDAIEKWNAYFSDLFAGESYPLQSMHGYGGYGPSYVNGYMAQI